MSCEMFRDYLTTYLKTDILLRVDMMENITSMFLKNFEIHIKHVLLI